LAVTVLFVAVRLRFPACEEELGEDMMNAIAGFYR
jgi:hypothetical protein